MATMVPSGLVMTSWFCWLVSQAPAGLPLIVTLPAVSRLKVSAPEVAVNDPIVSPFFSQVARYSEWQGAHQAEIELAAAPASGGCAKTISPIQPEHHVVHSSGHIEPQAQACAFARAWLGSQSLPCASHI